MSVKNDLTSHKNLVLSSFNKHIRCIVYMGLYIFFNEKLNYFILMTKNCDNYIIIIIKSLKYHEN